MHFAPSEASVSRGTRPAAPGQARGAVCSLEEALGRPTSVLNDRSYSYHSLPARIQAALQRCEDCGMKIFVSSRLDELFLERKTAVEVIHFEGHTPLYIETEKEVRDKLAKKTMLSLIADADALLSIHFLTAGRKFPILRLLTPIEFELEEFRRLHKGKPIFIFRRTQEDVAPNPTMLKYFDDVAKEIGATPITFQRPEDLQRKLRAVLGAYEHEADDVRPPYRVTVRYVGPDFIGLIGKISEVLFTACKFNIDYISHASQGGHATVCLSCSPRRLPESGTPIDKRRLRKALLLQCRLDCQKAKEDNRLIGTAAGELEPDIVVDIDEAGTTRAQLFVELRAIDAPGQLNAVCRVLRTHDYNIDELQLRPTPPEYYRQTTMTLRLSKKDGILADRPAELEAIESALRYLVGVRAVTTKHIIENVPNSTL